MIIVRPYSFSDIEALTELMTDLGTPSSIEDMKKRMEIIDATPGYFTFVASKDDIVVGMIGIRMQQSYVSNDLKTQIAALVTKKQYQGQGVGKALIKHVEAWIQEKGFNALYLTSAIKEERLDAHEFYKKLGYEINGYRFVKKIDKGIEGNSRRQ